MNLNKKIFNERKSKRVFLILLFFISYSILSAQDSSKTNYDLNDPRNPQCPCHKYQKQADDEYKKLLASANQSKDGSNKSVKFSLSGPNAVLGNVNPSVISQSGSSATDNISGKKYLSSSKNKHKKRFKPSPKLRRTLDIKHWRIFKRSKKLNSCFHWK